MSPSPTPPDLQPSSNAEAAAAHADSHSLPLLHTDSDLVAVHKPAGLLVHPTSLDAHEQRSALHLLQSQLGEPLWPLHRLDKATSGVLLFARSAAAASRWREPFEAGTVRKGYFALVRGWPAAEGLIDSTLARDPELPSAGQPRLPAQTRFRLLRPFEWPFSVDGRHATSRYALMAIEPLTGRRHQVRRHFKQIAHPLVGDTTHGKGAHNRAVAQWLGTPRLWLHAAWIELPGPDGHLRIAATPGSEWAPLLAGLASDPWADAGIAPSGDNAPTMTDDATPQSVIDFWLQSGPERWFRKNEAFDAEFRERFLFLHEQAAAGRLDAWAATPEGALALLLLLDQFPRNAFRDTPRMYATDARARPIARDVLARGWRTLLSPTLQQFVVLPLMHSEDLADHELCVTQAQTMAPETLRYAMHHRDIVARFGRFPHRNALLGRTSTPEELAFLAEGGFGG